MRKLEYFVIEKLRVTKSSREIDILDLMECKTAKEYESKCLQLLEYLENDSDLPIAELEEFKPDLKRLSPKYENTYDTFLWIMEWNVVYGTWDNVYSIRWSKNFNKVKNYNTAIDGFKEFGFNNQDISESGGIFVITENDDLMEQIDTLIKKSGPIS